MINPVSGNKMSKFISKMTKNDALAPIVALEGCVVAGRTYQAYKRGKWDEARERFIEETMGSITWLCGVKAMNALGDKLINKILKTQGKSFDVGTDKLLRTPFENFMKKVAPKGFSPTQVALIKSAKVLTSIIITNLFIGFVVPKLNQGLTNKVRHERKAEQQNQNKQQENNQNTATPAFKGGAMNAVNAFTNIIENTNTGQLLSSDAGIAGGRMYNARSKEERREIAIRDIGSIYFYMWARGHVANLLNLAESGRATRLNPNSTEILHEHLVKYLENNGTEMNVTEFKNAILGKNSAEIRLPENLTFETEKLSSYSKFMKKKPLEVIKLSDVEKVVTDSDVLQRAREMSQLQPQRVGESVLTKQQLIDAFNKAEINNPKLLDKVFTEFTNGDSKSEFKYISNESLYKVKSQMEDYIKDICKAAKDGKIDRKLLEKARKKNIMYSGLNFAAGFALSAAFLSTFIPKIQYYVTRKTTGVNAFPGTYDFEHHHEVEA